MTAWEVWFDPVHGAGARGSGAMRRRPPPAQQFQAVVGWGKVAIKTRFLAARLAPMLSGAAAHQRWHPSARSACKFRPADTHTPFARLHPPLTVPM